MPRQRIHHSRNPPGFPEDFSQRLVRFKEEYHNHSRDEDAQYGQTRQEDSDVDLILRNANSPALSICRHSIRAR